MTEKRVWWKHGVLYQIYPRSFSDANGDGTGDIPGITAKLDYLADLGIEGIWLSPINTSPMFDFGYDVSNYCDIDPLFGTLKDFEVLIEEAHRRGIRIIMDLVMNHTSHLHAWFIESRSARDNPKRDWYIWRNAKNGKVPNNWMAAFGGRAWEWDAHTQQYYLHLFLKEQPDVNWRNPELRQAMFDMIRFWLDKGVDGFRLDVCSFFVKDASFRDNPFTIGPSPRPYDLQKHLYDRNQPETHDILKEFRALLDVYDERMSVGEVHGVDFTGDPAHAASFFGNGTDELHLVFDFAHMNNTWGAPSFYERIKTMSSLIPGEGWPCHVFNNHDQFRSMRRYGKGPDAIKRAKILAALLITLRGTPFVYYGEEIGMQNGKIPRRLIQDPVGKKYWPLHPGRDPERTPMQWSPERNAGFTTGKPWLPVNSDYDCVNVENELVDRNSLLTFYKDLIAIRKQYPALQQGDMIPVIEGQDDIIVYRRGYAQEKLLIILNFSDQNRRVNIAELGGQVILSTHRFANQTIKGPELSILPYEATILKG